MFIHANFFFKSARSFPLECLYKYIYTILATFKVLQVLFYLISFQFQPQTCCYPFWFSYTTSLRGLKRIIWGHKSSLNQLTIYKIAPKKSSGSLKLFYYVLKIHTRRNFQKQKLTLFNSEIRQTLFVQKEKKLKTMKFWRVTFMDWRRGSVFLKPL